MRVGIDVGDARLDHFDPVLAELLLLAHGDALGVDHFLGDELAGAVVAKHALFGAGLEDGGLLWQVAA
ncbi:hypothetical protein D3C78_1921750 [compost metagenome]